LLDGSLQILFAARGGRPRQGRAAALRRQPAAARHRQRRQSPGAGRGAWAATLRGTPLALTRPEFRLLEVLARQPGRMFSRAKLLDHAWGNTLDVNARAIDSHIKNLRKKLKAASTDDGEWTRSVYGVGFAWEPPAAANGARPWPINYHLYSCSRFIHKRRSRISFKFLVHGLPVGARVSPQCTHPTYTAAAGARV